MKTTSRVVAVAVIVLLGLVLTSCSGRGGSVFGKSYTAEFKRDELQRICVNVRGPAKGDLFVSLYDPTGKEVSGTRVLSEDLKLDQGYAALETSDMDGTWLLKITKVSNDEVVWKTEIVQLPSKLEVSSVVLEYYNKESIANRALITFRKQSNVHIELNGFKVWVDGKERFTITQGDYNSYNGCTVKDSGQVVAVPLIEGRNVYMPGTRHTIRVSMVRSSDKQVLDVTRDIVVVDGSGTGQQLSSTR